MFYYYSICNNLLKMKLGIIGITVFTKNIKWTCKLFKYLIKILILISLCQKCKVFGYKCSSSESNLTAITSWQDTFTSLYQSSTFNVVVGPVYGYLYFLYSLSSPSSFNSSCTVFHEEQLDFTVAHLENCKRISRWTNWNSRWRQERSRWRHLDRNLWRWKTIQFNKHLLRWWKYCKWRWLPRMMQL